MRKKPTLTLTSPQTGTEYWLYVEKSTSRGPWTPVLFMDGDDQFTAATKAVTAQARGALPPLLLVGVGYGASYRDPANKRGRDYTPVAHKYEPSSGGADAFLEFLSETLFPELKRRYTLRPRLRGVAGHSLGSLLVLHALFQRKPFFTHFLASAPSLWWADRAMLRQVKKLRARQASLRAKLYLSVGQKDTESMTGDLLLLEQQLARKPFKHLEVISQRFPEHDHYDALLPAFAHGLKGLFSPSLP